MVSTYYVYAVDAADRLTLLCPPSPGNPHELKQVALSFIQAPKPARRQATGELGQDEPCAFEAMELIRSQCIGKKVTFEDDFLIEPLQRMSGRLTLPSGEDASELLLKNGLANTSDRIQPRMPKELFDVYVKLMGEARAQKKGIFSPTAKKNVRTLSILEASQIESAAQKLTATNNGEEKVRVERALSASSIVVTISSLNVQATVALAGVIAPFSKGADSVATDAAAEGKFHLENLLLHRNVTVRFHGVDAMTGGLLGSIVSPKGTFQEELLSKGFVKIHGATLGFVGAAVAEALQNAEKAAKEKQVGLWKEYSDTKLTVNTSAASDAGVSLIPAGGAGAAAGAEVRFEGQREFNGTVIQVVSSDTIVIKSSEDDGRTVRVSLSGLRASKSVQRDNDGRAPETRVTYTDYAWEAKELLRTSFIGKKVRVFIDYVRTIQETREQRPMATVVEEATRANLAAAVIGNGFGTFYLGRSDTCVAAVELQQSEMRAKERALGLHSGKDAPVTKVVELSRLGDSKGKYYLSFLQRGMQGNRPPVWRGVVDVVLGGGSFRVHIPKEHFQIPFKLAGVIAPAGALNPGDTADAFAAESKEFSVLHVQQREVDIQVDTSDRAGNFIGNLSLVGGGNFAVQLVDAGLATVSNAERLPYAAQLQAAQKSAQAAQRNIWSASGSVPQRQVRLEAQRAAAAPDALRPAVDSVWTPVVLADVIDGNTVFLQENTPAAQEQRAAIQRALDDAVAAASSDKHLSVAKNDLVCALFRDDGMWYRAKVLNVYKDEGYADVVFTDFGTKREVKVKDLRAFPTEANHILRTTPSIGFSAKLAFLKGRGEDAEYADAAYDEIFGFAESRPLFAKRVYETAKERFFLVSTSSAGSAGSTLNEHLLKSGLALVDKFSASVDAAAFKAMQTAQESARKAHLRLWKFGDADEDSDVE